MGRQFCPRSDGDLGVDLTDENLDFTRAIILQTRNHNFTTGATSIGDYGRTGLTAG